MMTRRLARALVQAIARKLPADGPGWILLEGIDLDLAHAIREAWPGNGLPPLAIAAPPDADFGDAALGNETATSLRNQHGLCLLVCEGVRIGDYQSVRNFDRHAPSDLVADRAGLDALADEQPAVPLTAARRAVCEALLDAKLDYQPSVRAVARFFEAMGEGAPAGGSLPLLGGFWDEPDDADLTQQRIVDNLNLAGLRTVAETLRPSTLTEIRSRAEQRLARRPEGGPAAAERVVELLNGGDDEILRFIDFEEAKQIIEEPPAAELPEEVERELRRHAADQRDRAEELRLAEHVRRAHQLTDPFERKDAARELLEFDMLEQEAVFSGRVRRRLRSHLRDRRISAPSLEEALIRGIDSLPSPVVSLELKEPQLPESASSEQQARAVLAVAAAHIRVAPLLRRMEAAGVEIAGALLADPTAMLGPALTILNRPGPEALRRVALLLRGGQRSHVVEVTWTPTMEDVALLSCCTRFAADAALALQTSGEAGRRDLSSATLTSLPTPDSGAQLAERLRETARAVLRLGYDPAPLTQWAATWKDAVNAAESVHSRDLAYLDALATAGGVQSPDGGVALTHLAPLKAEWTAARTAAWLDLLDMAQAAARGELDGTPRDQYPPPVVAATRAVATATAAQYPGYLITSHRDQPLLPTQDGAIFSAFGDDRVGADIAPAPVEALADTIRKLVDLHPEAAKHLRCIAWQDAASDLVARTVLSLLRRSRFLAVAEVVCIDGRPAAATLADLDDFARGEDQGRVAVRYVDGFTDLRRTGNAGAPEAHLAVVSGLTDDGRRLHLDTAEVPAPAADQDVLFIPKTWVRPNKERRVLLAPPRLSEAGAAWFSLMSALEDAWPDRKRPVLRIPELRTDASMIRRELAELHVLAQWVVTIDRFVSRDSLETAVGDDVAILHQERRVAGSSIQGLVISQRSGGTADRAIARSLRASGLLAEAQAPEVAQGLRKAASRGYGILALRAATTGSGINELIGHVAGFTRLTTDATPWPLPPGLRVILLSLDEYSEWFGRGRRADMLALTLSPDEGGVHAANIEVKAVKRGGADITGAMTEAKEQLRRTLIDSRFAAYPNRSLFSRLWLNRIVEAAVGVSRENRFRLGEDDLRALDSFRRGEGTLEWAGIGMVFGPAVVEPPRHSHLPLMGDRVPIVLTAVPLTADLLAQAAESDGTNLRTVATGRRTLTSPTKRRRSETRVDETEEGEDVPTGEPRQLSAPSQPGAVATPGPTQTERPRHVTGGETVGPRDRSEDDGAQPERPAETVPPELGWDLVTGEPVEWRVVGEGALSNGHVEIYGTSGAGKTQFIMSLLRQLKGMGSHFGVCDFKNDYGSPFPEATAAHFYDMWTSSLPYNPLAIDDSSRRALQGLIIELRDTVEIAARAFARLGHRQLHKLQEAFEQAFEAARREGAPAPTLADVHALLDDDLRGVIGDLTGTDLFGDGPPLGKLITEDAIFGLNHIPGTGLTTVLAAGFILSSLYLKLLEMPQVANTVTYTLVIDEAHRVASFHSVGNMVRELRSKGLAVILATQRPGDLPGEAGTNAQTKIYMRLPDAQSAKVAARNLDPSDRELPKLIRSLGDGEAYLSLAGSSPRPVKLRQFWRDDAGATDG